jgi:hypothetical protein
LIFLSSFSEDSFYDDDEAFLEAAKQAIEAKKPGPSTVASEPKTPEDSFYKNDSVFIEAAKQLNTVVAKAEPKTPGDSFYEDDVAFLEAAKQAIKSEPTGDTNVLLEDIPLPSSTNVPSWFQPNEHSTPLVGQVSNDSGNISLDLSVNFTPAPPVKKRKRLGMH